MDEAFVAAILEDALDNTTYLAYADWLDEQSDPRAEFLRIESELLGWAADEPAPPALTSRLRELHQALDPDWVTVVRRLPLNPLEELQSVVPPPKCPCHAVGNWDEIETSLGLSLPEDYKEFITTYGGGTVGCLDIPSPFSLGRDIRQWWEGWASFYRDVAEYVDIPYPIFPEPGGLLPFGTLGDVDNLNWLTVGEPQIWTFVYYNREDGFFEVKGLSAVEFVLEAVTQRSPLLIRIRNTSISTFDSPLDFQAHMAESRIIRFVHNGEIDIGMIAEQLASRWPNGQVRSRPGYRVLTLQIEPLAGSIRIDQDTGNETTLVSLHYDHARAIGIEQIVGDLLAAGFTEMSRS